MLLHHPSTLLIPTSPSFFTFSSSRFSFTPLSHSRRISTTTITAASAADTQPLPKSAIQRIAEKLRSLGYVEDEKNNEDNNPISSTCSPGQIFIPLPTHLSKYRVGHTLDPSWSTPESPVPVPGSGNAIQRFHELRGEVNKKKREEKKERAAAPSLAELTLPAAELKRLRTVGIALKKKLKVGKAGITEGIVNGIHERWRRSEVVSIKCDDICRLNMKRTHDLLERKTGGLVVWRSGGNIILYRGADYKYPYFLTDNNTSIDTSVKVSPDLCMNGEHARKVNYSSGMDIANSASPNLSGRLSCPPLIQGVGSLNKVRFQLPGEAQLAEEADRLLEGLGPRFTDWWGYDPLPVDGDLLPAVVPGYRRPFRLLPYGVSPKLTNDEMTILKRLGRPLPCHFVLGRNRKHQGLAASIVKLWEKCEIAKIAVKRGVQNTNSELMAEELKRLTGGILLSRDKEFIVLYRGKDFLPAAASSAIEERRKHRIDGAKNDIDNRSLVTPTEEHQNLTMGCASEDENYGEDNQKLKVEYKQKQLMLTEEAIKRTSSKLSMALAKKARAEELLAKLEKEEIPKKSDIDKEGITEEERYMLRKVGLRMKPFLLLGRRGVFDGTIENMHLHWKYRELVKIITGRKSTEEVHGIARTLEAESGGILVAVERVSKGYAIIVYRGKNYERPACLRPQTLLSKREAMKRSLEAQRRQSLKLHILKLSQRVDDLKLQLAKTKDAEEIQLAKELKLGLVQELETQNDVQKTEFGTSDVISVTNSKSYPSKPQVQVQETENIQLTEREISNPNTVTNSQSYPCEEQARISQVAELNSLGTKNQIDASKNSWAIAQQGLPCEISFQNKNGNVEKFDMIEQEPLPKVVPTRFIVSLDMQLEDLQSETNSSAIDNAKPQVSDSESTTSHVVPSDSESRPSLQRTVMDVSGRTCRALHLSNRERLVLRKQALKMKKRPVFAVGKSNFVTGVAKALKMHFEKHPLAIVNVKGRAKGTSVREVVFKLEQATGAVLVSQEPSKIILYRGWGAEEEPAQTVGKVSRERKNDPAGVSGTSQLAISPELISAIRLECGLQSNIEEEVALSYGS